MASPMSHAKEYFRHPPRSASRQHVLEAASMDLAWPIPRVKLYFYRHQDTILCALCQEDMQRARELKECPPDDTVVTHNQHVEQLLAHFQSYVEQHPQWQAEHRQEIDVWTDAGIIGTFVTYAEAHAFAQQQQPMLTYVSPVTTDRPFAYAHPLHPPAPVGCACSSPVAANPFVAHS